MSEAASGTHSMSEAQRLSELQSILFGDRFVEVDARLKQLEDVIKSLEAENQSLRVQLEQGATEIQALHQITNQQATSSNDNLQTVIQTLIDFIHRESLRDDALANAVAGLQTSQDEFAAQMMNQIKTLRKTQDKQYSSLQQTARDGQNDRSTTSDHLQSILTSIKGK